jgi:hypothetical protein
MRRFIAVLLLSLAPALAGATSKTSYRMINGAPINVLDYGAKCDGATDDYAAVSAMVTALGSTQATLVIPGTTKIGTNITIPSTLRVRFEGGATFTGAGVVTYTTWDNSATLATTAAYVPATNAPKISFTACDTTGSPGNATCNTPSGRSAIGAGSAVITITNSLVSTASIVFVQSENADATCTLLVRVTPAAGSFSIGYSANCTATQKVHWVVMN